MNNSSPAGAGPFDGGETSAPATPGAYRPRPRGRPPGIYVWSEVNPAEYQRARSMASMVAKTFCLESYQVLDGSRICRFQPARRVAAAIMHELMGIGNKKIARVFKVEKTTARRFRVDAARMLATDADLRRLYGLATEAICKRWPAYRK